ncbi:hypothetical protein RYX36_027295 [Vicia faba]
MFNHSSSDDLWSESFSGSVGETEDEDSMESNNNNKVSLQVEVESIERKRSPGKMNSIEKRDSDVFFDNTTESFKHQENMEQMGSLDASIGKVRGSMDFSMERPSVNPTLSRQVDMRKHTKLIKFKHVVEMGGLLNKNHNRPGRRFKNKGKSVEVRSPGD